MKLKMKFMILSFVLLAGLGLVLGGSYGNGVKVSESASFFMVSHSEYRSAEQGQVIGKLYNFRGDPIIVNECEVTIYNPDKTVFLQQLTDNTLEATDGTHYINFTTPVAEGIYEYKIRCEFPLAGSNQNRTVSNSFHLNPALNTITTINATSNGIKDLILAVNDTMVQEFDMVESNFTETFVRLQDIRDNIFTETDAYNNFTQVENNFQTVFGELDNIQVNLSDIINFCDGAPTADSRLCELAEQMNLNIIDINTTMNSVVIAKLDYINQTTLNTYNYMTGTLATNILNIFNTVTRIESATTDINNTVNRIESNVTQVINNQEEVIYISVMS